MKNLFYKQPEVLEAKDGIVSAVRRHHDKKVITVGMNCLSGGEILTLKFDTEAVGGMYAEIGKPGYKTAVNCIAF